jgi:hypothetical protein
MHAVVNRSPSCRPRPYRSDDYRRAPWRAVCTAHAWLGTLDYSCGKPCVPHYHAASTDTLEPWQPTRLLPGGRASPGFFCSSFIFRFYPEFGKLVCPQTVFRVLLGPSCTDLHATDRRQDARAVWTSLSFLTRSRNGAHRLASIDCRLGRARRPHREVQACGPSHG